MEADPTAALAARIVKDFGLAGRPPAERAEFLDRIVSMVIRGAMVRAIDLLSEPDAAHFDKILSELPAADPGRTAKVIAFVAARVPVYPRLLDQEYEEIKKLALEIQGAHEEALKHADETGEAIGNLLEQVQDAMEETHEIPGASVAGAAFDLLFDPARFRRTAEERQRRLAKSIAVLTAKTLALAWSGLLFSTLADALSGHRLSRSLPEALRGWVPDWYAAGSTGRRLLVVAALGAVAALIVLIVVKVTIWIAHLRRITPMFEMKVHDDELLSVYMRPLLEAAIPGIPEENLRSSYNVVYKAIYLRAGRPNRDDLVILEEMLKGGIEKSVVAFLKSKVRGYQEIMHEEAQRFCRESGDLMASIT